MFTNRVRVRLCAFVWLSVCALGVVFVYVRLRAFTCVYVRLFVRLALGEPPTLINSVREKHATRIFPKNLGIPVRTGPPYIYVRRRDPGPARPRSAPSLADPTDTRAHASLS